MPSTADHLISGADVARLLEWPACIDAVEDAFRRHAEGRAGVLSMGGFHVKAGMLGGYFVAKINGNFPDNVGLPTIQGVLVLCDANNGTPLAIMDSAEITSRRTAAATVVAVRHLARRDASSVAIVGCGVQGRAHVEALAGFRIVTSDRDAARAESLAAYARGRGIDARRGDHDGCDIIVTCTTSRAPILHTAAPGTFIAAVGADHPEKNEIAPDLMRAAVVITDVTAQSAAFGDLHHAPGVVPRAELGQVLNGFPGRQNDNEIVVFDSTGMALQDVAAAAVILRAIRP